MSTTTASAPSPTRIAMIVGALLFVAGGALFATIRTHGAQALPAQVSSGDSAIAAASSQQRGSSSYAQRTQRIRRELRELGSSDTWAGRYLWSSGFESLKLSLAPRSGAVMRPASDVVAPGPDSGFDCPIQVADDGGIHLLWSPAAMHSAAGFLSTELVPIRWGARRYLLPPAGLAQFAERINLGLEPRVYFMVDGERGRQDTVLLRAGDEFKPVWGLPQSPSGPLPGVRIAPQPVAVLGVEVVRSTREAKDCRISYRFTLDKGRHDGLRVGEQLDLSSKAGYARVRIEQVGPRQSTAGLERTGCKLELVALRKAHLNRTFYNPVAAQTALAAVLIERQRSAHLDTD